MITLRHSVDPKLMELLARTEPLDLINFLRKDVKENSKATLEAVRNLTPKRSGLLKQSLGITMKKKASSGEIFAIVSPRDNQVMDFGEGDRVLFTSATLKSIMKHKRFAKMAAQGVKTVSQKTPFLYVYGIEHGFRRNGRLARLAGGAQMFTRGFNSGKQGFIDNMGKDLWEWISKAVPPKTKPGNPNPLPATTTDSSGRTRSGRMVEYMRNGKTVRYQARYSTYRGRRRTTPYVRAPRRAQTYSVPANA